MCLHYRKLVLSRTTRGNASSIRRSCFAMLAAIAGTLGLPVSGAQAMEKDNAVIAALPFFSTAPVFIAKERGYFDAEGIDLEIKTFNAAQAVAVAVASGEIGRASCRERVCQYV